MAEFLQLTRTHIPGKANWRGLPCTAIVLSPPYSPLKGWALQIPWMDAGCWSSGFPDDHTVCSHCISSIHIPACTWSGKLSSLFVWVQVCLCDGRGDCEFCELVSAMQLLSNQWVWIQIYTMTAKRYCIYYSVHSNVHRYVMRLCTCIHV